ncbi:MAG: HMP-PP hydrolase (pyridoxal phosphatase) Cof, detected in genetic screen for thiamin metabolic genes (PMID:15292217) [uncultured Campylobacterales bacterium]|uniref:HMP-PP hydrolase (Pyridoxal phosphatase) Cof, detected in genetic screen for thiamin metabolic genes (PMID:15292217) n=1 Tax=uncultured Campylobacterales bacterium TaxID=352960 RepID=A0A6S6SUU4_9BACT|nr:MAG: HMP-PP hydrolase (pyridoxal phosphatase) Cof, detected in genetic screen for thiamin metabolic genes (PMID:15292217) [uncultured Campylobacterales bacterium]
MSSLLKTVQRDSLSQTNKKGHTITPKLIEIIFGAASMGRWNDYPRFMELTELDKQAHKFIIAYLLASIENQEKQNSIDMYNLIESGIFEFFRRVIVTDIRPDVFHDVLKKKEAELNNWVIDKLTPDLKEIVNGEFLKKFTSYLKDSNINKKERELLKAASYIATKWEFNIIYHSSSFLPNIDRVKESIDQEMEDYYNFIGIQKLSLNQKLSQVVDLAGRLRFQKRWAQTPRVPETSVLGHMLFVSLLSYFYSIEIKACKQRTINNFFTALFHDLPEALTRDIISPVKYSVPGLDEILSEYEIIKVNESILKNVPKNIVKEFSFYLGLFDDKKDEFLDKIFIDKIKIVDDLSIYNEDKYNPVDGKALKSCDRISAFIEATLSISYGIKSKELINGKTQILHALEKNPKVNGFDFYSLALDIQKEFLQ